MENFTHGLQWAETAVICDVDNTPTFHFGNVKKRMKKMGSKKSAPRCPFDRGRGRGVKRYLGNAHGNNTFQKWASFSFTSADDMERKLIQGLSVIVPLSNEQCLFRYLTPFLKSKKTPFPILHRRNCYKANRTLTSTKAFLVILLQTLRRWFNPIFCTFKPAL